MSDDLDDLEFSFSTHEDNRTIRISPYDNGVWLSLFMPGCHAYATLTKAEAQQLIDALTTVVGATEAA